MTVAGVVQQIMHCVFRFRLCGRLLPWAREVAYCTACYWVEKQNERFPERIAWRLESSRAWAIRRDCERSPASAVAKWW